MSEAVRIFVGCAANNEDLESQAVLEWSVRKLASLPVEFDWMQLSKTGRYSGWDTSQWATPFSGFRWGIPHFCDFSGRAIYMDSDVIVLSDIADLWKQKFSPGKYVRAKGRGSWRFCVSLWDCAGLGKVSGYPSLAKLKTDPGSHRAMVSRFKSAPFVEPFDGNWNCLDGENLPDLKMVDAIHYTAMANQPQLKYAIPRLEAAGQTHWFDGKIELHWRTDVIELFEEMLIEASANGYGPEKYVKEPFGAFKKRSLKNYRAGARGF